MDDLFEWNPEKAEANLSKHGVSFEEAETVFTDPLSLTVPAPYTPTKKIVLSLPDFPTNGDNWLSLILTKMIKSGLLYRFYLENMQQSQ